MFTRQGSHSDWKTWKMGRHFPVREKSGNFEQAGKVREKSGKTQNAETFREFQTNNICYFLVIFKCTVYHLLKWIKFSVKKQNFKKILEKWKPILEKWKNNTGKMENNTGKVREFCQSGKVGTMPGDLPKTIKICDNAIHRLLTVLMYKILKQSIQDSSKIVKILPLFCMDL